MSRDRAALYARLPVTDADRWLLDLADATLGGRVLELGAGAGRLTVALAGTGAQVTAVERDPAMLEALRRRVGDRADGRVDVVAADATALPAGLGPFDLVVAATSVLNELPTPRDRGALLRAAADVLAPGGRVALQLLGPWWLASAAGAVVGHLDPLDPREPPVEVNIELGELTAWPGRRRARLTYRFADGARLIDDLDAALVSPGELEVALAAAGLEVADHAGGADTPAWRLVCRPSRRVAAPSAGTGR